MTLYSDGDGRERVYCLVKVKNEEEDDDDDDEDIIDLL